MRKFSVIIVIALVAIASCDRTRSSTGWDYMPDMYYSNAYESFTPNPSFEDGLTMRTPVEGTVPRGMVPSGLVNTEENRAEAGRVLINPLEPDPENISSGGEAYHIFCISCHGPEGDGKGYLYTSNRYPLPPANLLSDKVRNLADGEIYHTITVGYGIMGAHGAMIPPEERWKIILYIRENLQKQMP